MAQYIPPLNFGMVEEDLYRSGQPNELNFPFLEQLELKKIIFLAPDDPSQQFLNFVEDQEIDLEHLGMDSNQNPWQPISEDIVLSALRLILDPSNYPLAVMCNLGQYQSR
eukprot:TRINITY_DN2227_c0_g1_i1.p1 TRINITY_DN2227_c0_g1~~TRINITY_DN2227_c0_g1_i1.p1  ORF type:complete len:110 (-),score=16.34 TRINITY_DN2227_c0_g1_i1:94-423(-)